MKDQNQSRRNFLKSSLFVIGSLPLAATLVTSAARADDKKPVEESNPTATALGYQSDASKVDTAKFPKRAGAEGAKQFCHGCAFYSAGGQKIAGMDGEYGNCSIFPMNLVNSNGWCNTWVQKPA